MGSASGWNKVYGPADDTKSIAIIVFVHGLFGHPIETWTSTSRNRSKSLFGRKFATDEARDDTQEESLPVPTSSNTASSNDIFWPRDLLPQTLPNVQIYSWGYDADVGEPMSSVSMNTIFRHARNLLNDLAYIRDQLKNRQLPLIFVAHGLGGLIVKDALNQSDGLVDRDGQSDILPATIGVCFLGTPHRGSEAASRWRRIFRATEIFGGQRANIKLLQALEKNSETIERITEGFYNCLRKYSGLQIFSFVEERVRRKFGRMSPATVDPESARIGHNREEIGSIPATYEEMTKFTSPRDTGFVRINVVLQRWVKGIQSGATGSG